MSSSNANSIVLATGNSGKLLELQKLLSPLQTIAQRQLGITDVEETGYSFIENALLKARHASRCSSMPALADDSGLVVDALQGKPGIYSARFAGIGSGDNDNIAKLLLQLESVPDHRRTAYFYCAIAYIAYPDDPTPIIATGRVNGRILHQSVGEQGFGYDPIFYIDTLNASMAQISSDVKNTISHRAIALQEFKRKFG